MSQPICAFPSCDLAMKAKGLCMGHYKQQHKGKPLSPLRKIIKSEGTCSFVGCDRPQRSQMLCDPHYQQQKRGKPLKPLRASSAPAGSLGWCEGPSCERQAVVKIHCLTHYIQLRRGSELKEIVSPTVGGGMGMCRGPECTRFAASKFLCPNHAKQQREGRELKPIRHREDMPDRFLSSGYWMVHAPEGHPNAGSNGRIFEHRLIMSTTIGRPLEPDETVHHINGVKTDNRPENLELWSSSHPSGQRVADKVLWAKAILARYSTSPIPE